MQHRFKAIHPKSGMNGGMIYDRLTNSYISGSFFTFKEAKSTVKEMNKNFHSHCSIKFNKILQQSRSARTLMKFDGELTRGAKLWNKIFNFLQRKKKILPKIQDLNLSD